MSEAGRRWLHVLRGLRLLLWRKQWLPGQSTRQDRMWINPVSVIDKI